MRQAVIIKSSKSGITLVLNPELSFDTLLAEILRKFQESEKFFSRGRFTISFEGKELAEEEQYQIVETITAYTGIDILCIMEKDELQASVFLKKRQEMAAEELLRKKAVGSFYRGSLLPQEQLETNESIIILGNVPKGASVVSKSDIIVLGALYGNAYAGTSGNGEAVLSALDFRPERYNIGGVYGEVPKKEKQSFFSKRNKAAEAKLAFVKDGFIIIRSLYEGFE